ncbi:serine/threonine-protein kinase [Streptomyces rishiriensis]|uniref:serine/threonine-protein kinase n=1 Tax=Streptomyces rishiriensis TaxID=68264 RepID=UPI0027D79A7C|nr:serine/threonine-protein kinase [Streptomyces rishiriensis]
MSGTAERVPRGYRVGDWEVGEPIADGGWGWVYEGRGAGVEDVDAVVALKFLPTAGLAPRQARGLVESARRESEFGRRADHPRLIRLLDSVVLEEPAHPELDGAVVLVMERAERSLRQLLGEEGQLRDAERERVLTEICEGLVYLHGLGWVHGDLKPDNVLLMADGSVRLSDFGLAAELDGTHGTHAWIPPLGTPDYLPPERWKAPLGERGVQVRPSADIWALGVMIHQMFTGGTSPFVGATSSGRAAAVQEFAAGRAPLRLDPAVPPFWRDLATDCLAPTHELRAAHTAQELLDRIRASATAADGATAPRGKEPAAGYRRRRRRLVLGVAAATVVCATAAVWSYTGTDDQDDGGSKGGTPVRVESIAGSTAPTAHVTVYNVEKPCRDRAAERDQQCSLGLALDPMAAYTIENVLPTRVWHGDVLPTECRMPQGLPVTDEVGTRSPEWYRVRLPDGEPGATAWLPAVRTKDRPTVPECG